MPALGHLGPLENVFGLVRGYIRKLPESVKTSRNSRRTMTSVGNRSLPMPASCMRQKIFMWDIGVIRPRIFLVRWGNRLHGLPIEKIIKSGPFVDGPVTILAVETSRMLFGALLSRCLVRHLALGTRKIDSGSDAVGHSSTMPPGTSAFQPSLPQSNGRSLESFDRYSLRFHGR